MRISPTEVITAEHVITGAGRVDVSVEGGTYQRATVALTGPVPSTSNITPLVTFARIGALWDIRPGNYAIGQQETV